MLETPSAEFKITSANRQAVKDWLAAQGFDATRVQSMRDQTLLKAYTDPRYLRALTNRGDYNPAVERNGTCVANATASGTCSQPATMAGAQSNGATVVAGSATMTGAPSTTKTPQNSPNATGSNANLPTRALSSTMAEATLDSAPAGPENTQGITEARVIELIRALAVLKPDVLRSETDCAIALAGLEGLEDLL